MDLSVVVPVFNEEENVIPLHRQIREVLESPGAPRRSEVIFVDDGSSDGTLARLLEESRGGPRLRIIRLRRNCGQTAAMKAGIDHARGEVIVTLDGDLQNDPRDILLLLRKLEEGYDLVTGWRRRRQDRFLTRTLPSRAANWLIGKITGVPIHDNGCSLKAYRARVIRSVPLYSEMHRFIPALTSMVGGRVAEVEVNHRPRRRGRSKYGLSRIWKVALDLAVVKTLLAFSRQPLRLFGWLAAPPALLFVLSTAASLSSWFAAPEKTTVVFPALAFLSGYLIVHLLLAGLLGELLVLLGPPVDFSLPGTTRHGWKAKLRSPSSGSPPETRTAF
jgi:glycosyltransferase involved in cell wall biosynthesis